MIGIPFRGPATENSQIALMIRVGPPSKEKKNPPSSVNQPHIAILARTVSDKLMLCQLALGLRAGLSLSFKGFKNNDKIKSVKRAGQARFFVGQASCARRSQKDLKRRERRGASLLRSQDPESSAAFRLHRLAPR